jgi:site-specific DNA-cytosine methylase
MKQQQSYLAVLPAPTFYQGEQHGWMDGGTPQGSNDMPAGTVRDMRRCECGSASQERGLEGSSTGEPTAVVQELPHEGASVGREVHAVREVAQGAGVLRHALPTLQKARRSGIQTDATCLHCGGLRVTEPLDGLLREARTAGEAGHAGNGPTHQERGGFTPMAVRRLTPTECERLQGFPDGYTNIPWRKQPTSPDGPRYKALGNSMAVPVMAWIGRQIQRAVE